MVNLSNNAINPALAPTEAYLARLMDALMTQSQKFLLTIKLTARSMVTLTTKHLTGIPSTSKENVNTLLLDPKAAATQPNILPLKSMLKTGLFGGNIVQKFPW